MSNPVVWFEVTGQDADSLKSFYGGLFGWQYAEAPGAPGYGLVDKGEGGIPGGVGPAQGGPQGWDETKWRNTLIRARFLSEALMIVQGASAVWVWKNIASFASV